MKSGGSLFVLSILAKSLFDYAALIGIFEPDCLERFFDLLELAL